MSIKRYTAAGEGIVRTDANGELVLFSDYSRLKTEVERLDTLCHMHTECKVTHQAKRKVFTHCSDKSIFFLR